MFYRLSIETSSYCNRRCAKEYVPVVQNEFSGEGKSQ
jgi:hypothetical protein